MTTDSQPRRQSRVALQVLAVLLILGIGVAVSALLIQSKTPPQRTEQEAVGPLVQVHLAGRGDEPVIVTGHGSVEPLVRIDLVPQVAGKVTFMASEVTDGGRFDANTPLIRIEKIDYKLAVEQAEAAVATAEARVAETRSMRQSARTNLQIEQAEADVAKREWRKTHGESPIPPLVSREPQVQRARSAVESAEWQLASARAEVAAAKSRLREAQLQLQRTQISVPFAGRVISESVDVGQYVTVGQPLASVYASDRMKVVVPMEDRHLPWFELAGETTGSPGARVELSAAFGGREHQWHGRAVRTAGRIDPQSRLVDVVVEVDRTESVDGTRRLIPGMFVDVAIEGRTLRDVVSVPRHALRGPDSLWVATDLRVAGEDANAPAPFAVGRLVTREVEVVRADRDRAYIVQGLEGGEAVVTSLLDVVTEGMRVRVDADVARAMGAAVQQRSAELQLTGAAAE